MPITTEWYESNRILLTRYTGAVSLADILRFMEDFKQVLDDSSTIIHTITDFRGADEMPRGSLEQVKGVQEILQHKQLGWSTSVAPPPMVTFIYKTLMKVFGLRLAVFDSVEEAVIFLHKLDEVEARRTGQHKSIPPTDEAQTS